MRYFWVTLLLAATASLAVAQEAELRPKEPLTLKAPNRAYWKVTTLYKAQPDLNDANKKRRSVMLVRKEGKIIQEIMELDGKRYESYIIGWLRIGDHGEKDTVTSISPNDPTFAYYGKADFGRMSWLTIADFKKVEEEKGRKVFVFQHEVDGPQKSIATVKLDAQTQLPISYSDGEVDETYEYLPVPDSALVIPANFKKRLTKELEYLAALQRAGN